MKRTNLHMKSLMLFALIMLTVLQSKAQENYYNLYIANDVQTAANVLEFDVYLKDMDPSQIFELSSMQLGIYVDSAIRNGGVYVPTMVPGTSEFNAIQTPISGNFSYLASLGVKVTPRTTSPGNGTIISKINNGSRMCRIRLTNTVPFATGSHANLAFSFINPPTSWPTKVNLYINGSSVFAPGSSSNCTNISSNTVLNPIPAAPTGSASQSFCVNISPTIAQLTATGSNIKWYDAAVNGNLLAPTQALVNGAQYYATQSNFVNESSARLQVTVTINNTGTWIGATSNNWNEPSNWCGGMPVPTTNIVVPAGDVHITSTLENPAVCNNLTIEPGAVLTVEGGKAITITGTLTNNSGNAGIVIESNSTETGSLIESTPGIIASVQRYMVQGNLVRYHYISSPVVSAPASVFLHYYMYRFDEPTAAWINIAATDNLEVMKGYSVYRPYASAMTKLFQGELNCGPMGTQGNVSRTDINKGWNLLGNPYASAINLDASEGWTKTNVSAAVYLWNQASKSYVSYVPGYPQGTPGLGTPTGTTGIIPAMQGFMVRAAAVGSGTLLMNDAVRVHSGQPYWKSSPVDVLRISATSGEFKDEAVVRFDERSSAQFDDHFDAFKILSEEAMAQLYTLVSDENLSINTLPKIEQDLTVPLNMKINTGGDYKITADGTSNFDSDIFIYLEDVFAHSIIDLKQSPEYSFSSTPNDESARFKIHFSRSPLTSNVDNATSTRIFSYDNTLHINTPLQANGSVELYNAIGQQIFSSKLQPSTSNSFALNAIVAGCYIAKVINEGVVTSTKVLIK